MIKKSPQSPDSRTVDTISDSEDECDSDVILDDFDRIAARLRHVTVRVGASASSALTQTRLLTELLQLLVSGGNYNVLRQHDRLSPLISFAMQCIQAGAGEERGIKVSLAILYQVSLDSNSIPYMRDESLTQTLLVLIESMDDAKRGEGKADRARRRPSPEILHKSQEYSSDDVDALVSSVFTETMPVEFYQRDLCWTQNIGTISLVILRRIKDEESRLTPIEVTTYSRLAQQEGLAFHRAENQTAENVLRLFLLLELIDDMETLQSLAFDSCIFVAILRASERRKVAFVSELIEKTLRILTILSFKDCTWLKWETLVKGFLKILFDVPGSSFLWGQASKTQIHDDEQTIRLLTLGVLGSLGEENVACARAIASYTITHKVPQKTNQTDGRILEVLADCFLLLKAKDPSETKSFTTNDHYTCVTKCTLAVVLAHICGDLDGYNRLLRKGCTAASFLESLRLFLVVLQKADLLQDDAVLRIDSAMQRWTAYEKGLSPNVDAKTPDSEQSKSKPKTASCVRFSPKARVQDTSCKEAEFAPSPKRTSRKANNKAPQPPSRTPLLRRRAAGQADTPRPGCQRPPFSFSKLNTSASRSSSSQSSAAPTPPKPNTTSPKTKPLASPQKGAPAPSPPKARCLASPQKASLLKVQSPTRGNPDVADDPHTSAGSTSSPNTSVENAQLPKSEAPSRNGHVSRISVAVDDDVAVCIDDDLTICASLPQSRVKSWHYHLMKTSRATTSDFAIALPSFAPPPPKRRIRNRHPPPPILARALQSNNTPPIRELLVGESAQAHTVGRRKMPCKNGEPERPVLLKRTRKNESDPLDASRRVVRKTSLVQRGPA